MNTGTSILAHLRLKRVLSLPITPIFLLFFAVAVLGTLDTSFAQTPNISATLDEGVPLGTYRQNGNTLTYTTVITNGAGAGSATGVMLTNPTPTDTTLVAGSVHASPLAINDSYTAVGNTKLYVGVTPPVGEPALASATPALFANDTTITDTNVFVSATTPANGSVSVNSDGTFVYSPNAGFTGSDSFTYTIRNSADGTLTDTGTVSITVSNLVWYVNNAAAGGGSGTSTSPLNSLAGLNGPGGSGDGDGANDFIYVYRGTGAAYTGGLPLESGQVLTSETNALVVGGSTLRAAQAVAVPTLSHNTGSTVTLSTGNTINGFLITNFAGNGISGAAIGTTVIADIAVSVTGGTALSVTTSGTLTITGSANTLNSTTGTALNVENVTIGAANLNFLSISAGNNTAATDPANGVVLNNTGSTGGLIVTGDAGGSNNGSGGIIQFTSGSGILLTNTSNASFDQMNIHDTAGSGVRGTSGVVNFTFTNGTTNNTGSTSGPNGGDQESSIAFNDPTGSATDAKVTGNVTITGNLLTNALWHGVSILQSAGTLNDVNISDNVLISGTTTGAGGTSFGSGIQLSIEGIARAAASVTQAELNNNTITNFPGGALMALQSGTANFSGPVTTYGVVGSATRDIEVMRNVLNGGGATIKPNHIILATVNGRGQGNFNIQNNGTVADPLSGSAGNIIDISAGGDVTLQAIVSGNRIDAAGQTVGGTSGIAAGVGPFTFPGPTTLSTSTLYATVQNNVINNSAGTGIRLDLDANVDYPTLNAIVTGNTVGAPISGTYGIQVVQSSNSSFTGHTNLRISGNTSTGGISGFGITFPGIGLRKVGATFGEFAIQGLTPSPASNAQMEAYVSSQNPSSASGSFGTGGAAAVNGSSSNWTNIASVPQPGTVLPLRYSPAPTEVFMTGTAWGVTLHNGRSGTHLAAARISAALPRAASRLVLSQANLDATVNAALTRWEAAGLTGEQVAWLRALRFEITTLGDLHLGEAAGDVIRVDSSAFGNGWFVGSGSTGDAQFREKVSPTRLYTDPADAPAGRIDLLTAVMHEMGHALGLEDTYSEADRDALMYGFLTKGERRLPSMRDALAARAPNVATRTHTRSHFLSSPLTIGTLPPGKSVTVKYQATITSATATQITNQGTVSGNFTSVLTDDPNTGAVNDPTLTDVAVAPVVTADPTDQTTDVGLSNATFTAAATSYPTVAVQWQVHTGSDGPGVFNPVPGGTSTTLTITSAALAQNGNIYRAVFTNTATTPTSTATTAQATLTVNPALSIAPTTLAAATAGSAINQTITISNGATPYSTLTVTNFVAGGTGLTAANVTPNLGAGTVVVSGTPTGAGTATFTVTVTDPPGGSLSQAYTLIVNPASSIAPAALAGATAGAATNQTITVSGGTKPYTTFNVSAFSAGGTGLTAANLSTDATAGTVALSGTPTAPGTASFNVNVIDTAGATLTKTYTLTVGKAATEVSLTSPAARVLPGALLEVRIAVSTTPVPAAASPGPAAAAVVPTGYVAISEGARSLGVLPLVDGQATFQTRGLTTGMHLISVVYQGSPTLDSSSATMQATVDPRIGPEFRVNRVVANSQQGPSMARLSDKGVVIVWQSNLEDRSGWGIFGQRYDAAGRRVGGEFLVNRVTAGTQAQPSVAAFGAGGFVVAWTTDEDDSLGVRAQRFSASGGRLGSELVVNVKRGGRQWRPSVAALSNGAFIIVWASDRQDGSLVGVYGRLYDAVSGLPSGEFLVSTRVAGSQAQPSAAALADGGFVVTWMTDRQTISAQRFTAAGAKRGGEFQVNTAENRVQVYPSAAPLKDGGFIIAWESAKRDGSDPSVSARRYRSNGAAAGDQFPVNSSAILGQYKLAVTGLQQGGFAILWSRRSARPLGLDVLGQVFDFAGRRVDVEFSVNTTLKENQWQPALAPLGDSGLVAAWVSNNQDGSLEGVYGQRLGFGR